MDDVFQFRDKLIQEYARFSRSFVQIAAPDIRNKVEEEYANGRYWPEPLVQINPHYQRSGTIRELVDAGTLHPGCLGIFQTGKTEGTPTPLSLYTHQKVALHIAQQRKSYVVTTGTGSGKSLSFFIPIIDRILKPTASLKSWTSSFTATTIWTAPSPWPATPARRAQQNGSASPNVPRTSCSPTS